MKRKRVKRATRHPDAVQEFVEWQETQYLPGYWVGGKIPPFLKGKRPNRYGYVLIGTGLLLLLVLVLMVVPELFRPPGYLGATNVVQNLALGLLFVVLQLVAGVSLLRRRAS